MLEWSSVAAFGADAVMASSGDDPSTIDNDHQKAAVKGDVTMLGARVLTVEGVEVGTVDDVEFDTDSGTVVRVSHRSGPDRAAIDCGRSARTRSSSMASRRRRNPDSIDVVRRAEATVTDQQEGPRAQGWRRLLARGDRWPLIRQFTGEDPSGRGPAARSGWSAQLEARTDSADRVVQSICPFCAVGCGQRIFVKDEQIIQIEGDPDSPISRGHLCPKGAATRAMVQSPTRLTTMKYRRPHGAAWEDLPIDEAMRMIADRVVATRRASWEDRDEHGHALRRCMGIASLGGATLDNEENYLWKKAFTSWGAIQIENQARI